MKYKQLVAQIEKLTKKANDARRAETAGVVNKIRAMMDEFGITLADLKDAKPAGKGKKAAGGKAKKSSGKGSTVAPKYRNPSSGETWTGRGRQPVWVREFVDNGGSLDALLIKD